MLAEAGWDELSNELRRLARTNSPIRYVPNPGNAGDALIAAGTWQLFDDLGIRPDISRARQIQAGDVAIYGGGGNLVPEYVDCQRFLERCFDVGAQGLVLSQSVRGHEALLGRLDERFTIVCRDHSSLATARSAVTKARVILAPDLALRIDVERLATRCKGYWARTLLARHFVLKRKLPAYWRWRRALAALPLGDDSTVNIIRTDVEAVATARGQSQWDVSHLYLSDLRSREECDFVANDLLNFVRRAKRIVTNRLHAGIAGALVGAEVTFLDNSYGKIRAVYEAWLKDVKGVGFAGSVANDSVDAAVPAALVAEPRRAPDPQVI